MYRFILLIGFICFLSFPSLCFAWWQYNVDQDKMTDEIMSVMTWTTNRKSRVILGVVCRPEPKNPALIVRYGWYSAKYHWATEKTNKDIYFPLRVDYRIDKNPPVTTYWDLDTAYLDTEPSSFPVIEKTVSPKDSLLIGLIKGRSITFRLHDPTANLQDVTFSLSGSGEKIHRVINACK